MADSLSAAFLEALAAEHRPLFQGAAGIEDALRALVARATSAWPDLEVSPEAFVRRIATGLPPDREIEPAGTFASIHAEDLWLACACAAGQDRAIAAFDRYLSEVDAAARRMGAPTAVADEARQVVRQETLVTREGGRAPGIAGFSGRGDLRSWVRVTAVRHVMRVLTAAKKHREFEDDALYDVLAPVDDPELDHFKRMYKGDFVAAFRDAIKALTGKQRNLLRYQAIEGLSIDEIGQLYDVHRATAARWLAKAREDLLSGTRRSLMTRLQIGRSECESIMRLLQSRLDISLERFLAVSRDS